jgi:hypothetical protein
VSTVDEIERLSRRRSKLRLAGDQTGEIDRLTDRLEDLYSRKRSEQAQQGARSRADITRRARVEAELERLITVGRS